MAWSFFERTAKDAKNGVKKKWDQVTTGADQLVSVRPQTYKSVQDLMIQLKAQIRKKDSLPEDVVDALEQLNTKLNRAKEKFDREFEKGINLIKFAVLTQEFNEESRSAIYKYQPTLMAAPGVWNKIAAYINAFLEKYCGGTLFDVEDSVLGKVKEFRQQFDTTKDDLMPKASPSDSEDSCSNMFGCFNN
ncbi:Uncharacterised protein [Legionella steigerwaltii]|uniref:Uncharacterized protein n=1 Tax=Legionella steigerwaltii TaxID=460 RepID=A0A378LBN3_9GAMM|nr:hypothetical protein [Legionella steigerwaltii]KTD75759.1 hypothetical protein Lstg_2438 [Legionella steigerwaltii]STY23730.1 Uncharacterised protein [Legionella steigerwaltii]